MKTKSILLMAIVLMSSAAFADEPNAPKLVVLSQKESGLFKVIYDNPQTPKVKMTILNSEGVALYTESIKSTDGFILPVNFKGLTPGEYSIEIADGANKQVQKVSYATSTKTQNIHIAKLGKEANKYLLSVANEGSVNVKILDGAFNIIHDQNVNVANAFGIVYNLKGVQGAPTFEVTDASGNVKTVKY